MAKIAREHLRRLRARVEKRNGMANLAKWVREKTTLGMEPYSFKDHEYQEVILSDTSPEVVARKPSQVGMSEATARLAVAMVNVVSPLTVIYTLPTATFSATFMKTRIDPIIQGSEEARENVHRTNDNSSMKQFGESYLYVKGAASSNAPISIPADVLIHDEVDFCDQDVLSQYTSRLTHSKWKLYRRFSTPTIPKYGIDRAFQESRRHFNLCKCNHCGHWSNPDYYRDVKIPGYLGDLRSINKQTLRSIRWREAVLLCPRCGKAPSLAIEHREFVCENPDDNYEAAGYQVSPFDAPAFITCPDLIKSSTNYEREQDFVNFSLGLPMEDKSATLTLEDFRDRFVLPGGWSSAVMGVDVGATYHFKVGAVRPDGKLVVLHAEQVPMGRARERYHALRQEYRVTCTVMDSQPHSETVMGLQAEDPNLYAAIYTNKKGLTTYTVRDEEGDEDDGKSFVRQVDINRSRAFDSYMHALRSGDIEFVMSEIMAEVQEQHTSMKRVKGFDGESGEMIYTWQKTDGNDHFHHAGVYLHTASKIRGLGSPIIVLPLFTVSKIRVKA